MAGAQVCVSGIEFEPHVNTSKVLESIQRRAMQIIFLDNDYMMALMMAELDMLKSQCAQLNEDTLFLYVYFIVALSTA